MSSSSSTSITTSSSGTLTSLTGSSTLQLTGLSSGIDTDQVIEELMEAKEQPMVQLQGKVSQMTAQDTELTTLANELDVVANDADAMLDPSLYHQTQTVSSTNSTAIGAALTSGNGAVEGGYQVEVTQLAQSAQRTFDFTSPTSADTVTIDGQAVTISAGESASSFASAINANSNLDVYATVTKAGTIVMSNRTTGNTDGDFIAVSDSGGALSEVTSAAKDGQDAEGTIDGVAFDSASNTVTDAIPGVTLTLNAVTGSSPVTVDIGAPATDTSAIAAAVQQFISDYNTAITDVQAQLAATPSSSNGVYTGTLYNDQDLRSLLAQMRDSLVATVSGTDSGLSNLLELGISTGATTGVGTISTSALDGDLTLDTSTLTAAISSDPTGVQKLLSGWANNFATLVSNAAASGGTMSTRIQSNTSEIGSLNTQISAMQAALDDQEQQLVEQYAAMESALSSASSESTWLTDQEDSLNAND
jgi:flagellar hook-associated protein 2